MLPPRKIGVSEWFADGSQMDATGYIFLQMKRSFSGKLSIRAWIEDMAPWLASQAPLCGAKDHLPCASTHTAHCGSSLARQ